jgi:hypothetical protein
MNASHVASGKSAGFYLVFTPLSFLLCLLGKDFLRLHAAPRGGFVLDVASTPWVRSRQARQNNFRS